MRLAPRLTFTLFCSAFIEFLAANEPITGDHLRISAMDLVYRRPLLSVPRGRTSTNSINCA